MARFRACTVGTGLRQIAPPKNFVERRSDTEVQTDQHLEAGEHLPLPDVADGRLADPEGTGKVYRVQISSWYAKDDGSQGVQSDGGKYVLLVAPAP